MAADDIESQIKQCRAQLSTAQNLYWQSKFQEAEELYKQCLSKLDHIFPGENLDTAACLLGLGDTYYFQSRYLLALNQYTRLLAIREKLGAHDVPSVITANLKVAKTHEKLQEFDEAAKHFKRSLDLAQTNLSIGDPLLLNLLEAYCNFLRQAQPESGLIHDLERKAELCRKKAAEMAGEPPPPARNERPTGEYVALGQPKREQKDRAKAAQAAQSLYPTALEYDTAEKSSAHLKSIGQSGMIISALVACSLLIFVTMVGGAIYCAVTGGREGAVVKAEQDFATIDGDRKIHFLAGGKAELTRGTTTAQIRYQTLSNPVEGILFLIGGQNSNAPYCLKTDAGIIYPESADFYTNDSAEFKVVEHMKLVAATLEKFYEENKRYPENFEEFIQLDPKLEYKNAFTGLRQMPSYVTGMWGDSGDPEALNALLAKTGHLDTKKMDPTVCYVTVAKSLPAGGVMSLCVGPKEGKPAAFYVLGADRAGVLFRNCTNSQGTFLVGSPGQPPHFLCPESGKEQPIAESAIVISRRGKADFFNLLLLACASAALLVPVIGGWFFLRGYQDKVMIAHGTMREKAAKIQRSRLLFLPFIVLYIAVSVAVIAEGMGIAVLPR